MLKRWVSVLSEMRTNLTIEGCNEATKLPGSFIIDVNQLFEIMP